MAEQTMRVVCISDTHGRLHQLQVPDGDVVVHAGDLSEHGTHQEVERELEALAALPHRWKVVIAGNHDFALEEGGRHPVTIPEGVTYLQDSGVTLDGVRFWGAPWTPYFGGWAFNVRRGPALAKVWARIPEDTDVLVTHGPPHGILDAVRGELVGCADLLQALERVRPRLHVCGHIHESYGTRTRRGCIHVNAASAGRWYSLNAPVVVKLARRIKDVERA